MLERITTVRDLKSGKVKTTEGMEYVEVDGKLFQVGLRTATPEEVVAFSSDVNAAVMAERDEALATIADLNKSAEALKAEHAAALSDLSADHAKAVSDLNTAHAAEVASLNEAHAATIADMNTAAKVLADENAATLESLRTEHATAVEALNAELAALKESVAAVTAERDDLAKQLAECEAKCESMESHPDVVAKRKEEAVAKARAEKLAAVEAIRKADEILAVADVADVDQTVENKV